MSPHDVDSSFFEYWWTLDFSKQGQNHGSDVSTGRELLWTMETAASISKSDGFRGFELQG